MFFTIVLPAAGPKRGAHAECQSLVVEYTGGGHERGITLDCNPAIHR